MKIAVFAYSRQGCKTARRLLKCFAGYDLQCYTMARFEEPGFGEILRPSKSFYGDIFHKVDALVFVGSAGIAVREIAPHVRSKATDPAVICIDELGTFVIPLLSGHIGGANALAEIIAKALDSLPVITTATDINRKFSADTWAVKNGYGISSLTRAKELSAAILERDVLLRSDYPIATGLPNGVRLGKNGEVGISLSIYCEEPFEKTLRLIPPIVHLGIGCRKGTECDTIREAVNAVLKENGIDHRAIKCAASIDLKAGEVGLLEYCRLAKLPVTFYTAEQLRAVSGEFTPSEFVQSITGVDNVCERAALIGAEELIVRKTVRNGVTVALAAEAWEVRFG